MNTPKVFLLLFQLCNSTHLLVFGKVFSSKPHISSVYLSINGSHFMLAAINFKDLRQPGVKMSKSEGTERGRINLTDSPDVMLSKIRKSVTDMTSKIAYEPETRPGVSNLVAIHSAVTNKSPEELCQEAANLDTEKYGIQY